MVAATRIRSALRATVIASGPLASGFGSAACDLPPTRRALTVWAEPPIALESTAWYLAAASCVGGRALAADQLAMRMRVQPPAQGPLELVLEGHRLTCHEQLTVELVATQLPRKFVWMEQSRRQQGAQCSAEHDSPAIVSFSQERRLVVLRGPILGLCGALDAELLFAAPVPVAQADRAHGP